MDQNRKAIDWCAASRDGVLVYGWNGDIKPETTISANLYAIRYDGTFVVGCYTSSITYEHVDFSSEEDRIKYTCCEVDIPDIYRPCLTLEEFMQFFGKLVMNKEERFFKIITEGSKYGGAYKFSEWFKNYELVEPINGSKIIGIKKEKYYVD